MATKDRMQTTAGSWALLGSKVSVRSKRFIRRDSVNIDTDHSSDLYNERSTPHTAPSSGKNKMVGLNEDCPGSQRCPCGFTLARCRGDHSRTCEYE